MGWRADLREEQERPVAVAALTAALRSIWPDVEVTGTEPLTGGLGSVLHRVELTGAPLDTVVLRRLLPAFGDDAETVRREVAVHAVAPHHGAPVPRVHWSDPEGTVLGGPALVLDHVPGRLLLGDLAESTGIVAFADVHHRVHAVPTEELAGLPVLTDVTDHADRFGPPGGASHLVDDGRVTRALDRASRWFRPEQALVHMDLHGGNVLWDGSTVTGVLDWPGAAIGVAAADEGYAWLDIALARGVDTAAAFQTALDERRTGPAPAAGEVELWRACALRRALPTPAPWAEAYRAAGLEVTDEQVEERFVQLVDELGRD